MRTWDLLSRLAHASNAQSLAQRTLGGVLAFTGGCCGILFAREQERMALFSSIGLRQVALDHVEAAWASHRSALLAGRAFVESSRASSWALVPVMEGPQLAGLLYVSTESLRFADARDIEALAQFSRILALSLSLPPGPAAGDAGVDAYLEKTPTEDVARQQLLVLLERHEWNISRVARILGVTRATIYNRLDRLGLERKPRAHATSRRQTA